MSLSWRRPIYASCLCVLVRFILLGRLALGCQCSSHALQHAVIKLGWLSVWAIWGWGRWAAVHVWGRVFTPLSFCREGGGRDISRTADGTKSLIPFSSRCCRWRPRVKRSQHYSSSAGCMSVKVRTRKGNNHKSSLVWAIINLWYSAFIFMWLFFFSVWLLNYVTAFFLYGSWILLSFPSPSLPFLHFSVSLFLHPTLALSGSFLPLQACASLWTCSWTPCPCWGTSFFSASLSSSSSASSGCSCGPGCSATAASWRKTSQCECLGDDVLFLPSRGSSLSPSLHACLLQPGLLQPCPGIQDAAPTPRHRWNPETPAIPIFSLTCSLFKNQEQEESCGKP